LQLVIVLGSLIKDNVGTIELNTEMEKNDKDISKKIKKTHEVIAVGVFVGVITQGQHGHH